MAPARVQVLDSGTGRRALETLMPAGQTLETRTTGGRPARKNPACKRSGPAAQVSDDAISSAKLRDRPCGADAPAHGTKYRIARSLEFAGIKIDTFPAVHILYEKDCIPECDSIPERDDQMGADRRKWRTVVTPGAQKWFGTRRHRRARYFGLRRPRRYITRGS